MVYLKSPDLQKEYLFTSISTNEGIIERTPCVLVVFSTTGKCLLVVSLDNLRQELPNILSQFKGEVRVLYYAKDEDSDKLKNIIATFNGSPVLFDR